ncbi:hypothetical protein CCP3SC1AL1_3450004 [Gammaproteobacteria bacterium]
MKNRTYFNGRATNSSTLDFDTASNNKYYFCTRFSHMLPKKFE